MASQLPDDFKCPISLEIMSDPVILTSGHTFDRSSIQRWLDSGNRTCPITQLPLPPQPSLIPNYALRSLISHFTPPNPTSPKKSPQNPKIKSSISTLTSPSSTPFSKLEALNQLKLLSKHSQLFRQQITESGAVSGILLCVSSDYPQLQESAITVLFNLSLDDDNRVGLVAEGAVSNIVTALRTGSPAIRAMAATVMTSLAMVGVNKGTIGSHPSAIKALVELLSEGNRKGKKEAATALYTLCSFPDNKRRTVEAGAVPILIGMIEAGLGSDCSIDRPVEVLNLLSWCSEGREKIGKFMGFVGVLVRVLKDGSSRSREHALSMLSSLCSYSVLIAKEAKRNGCLEICFGLVGDENGKIRKNASGLIQVLQLTETSVKN